MHIHNIVRIRNLHALWKRLNSLFLQCFENLFTAANKHNLNVKLFRRADCAKRNRLRRIVAAPGVNPYPQRKTSLSMYCPQVCGRNYFVISSMIASERCAIARFLFALPLTR